MQTPPLISLKPKTFVPLSVNSLSSTINSFVDFTFKYSKQKGAESAVSKQTNSSWNTLKTKNAFAQQFWTELDLVN